MKTLLPARTMKIFYDYTIFSAARHGGIARYFVELASQMEAEDDVLVFAGLHVNSYVARVSHVFGMRVPCIKRSGFIRRAVNDLVQPVCIRNWSPDVIHRTYYDRNAYRRSRVPVVITIHDMIPEKRAPKSPICALKRAAVAGADRIIAVSEYTKAELCERLAIDPSKVTTVHHGSSFSEADRAGTGAPFDRPYILYVGARAGYKNFDRLLCALSRSPLLTGNFPLVCCGGVPFSRAERRRISSLGLAAVVRHMPAEDERLARLYKHARALVYPSLDEGFGLPPLEAMSMGCPLLCSHSGAIPEVVGDAGHYFNPADEESIRVSMETVLFDDSRLQELARRGKQRSKAFSWQRCVETTRLVYRDVALK
jgi:glycosyltransferase involved in cell wall biosynthesis